MTAQVLRLHPWLVRALIPPRVIGTYVIYSVSGRAPYVGRSDTDIRRRLLRHCADQRGDYFTYGVQLSAVGAYDVECALFHLLAPGVSNRIHPDRPDFHPTPCAFCLPGQRIARSADLHPSLRGHVEPSFTDPSKDRR